MLEILEFDFMRRALIAGLLAGIICPVIGAFIVMRRQSLIGDGLGHIAFAGVVLGWLTGFYPVLTATAVTVAAGLGIEELRDRKPAFADMILAVFSYAGIGIAVLLSSMSKMSNVSLIGYLFGSIVTVSPEDVVTIGILATVVLVTVKVIYKELLFLTFDPEVAFVSGLPAKAVNLLFAALTAVTVSVSMRIVGILLVSALIVIPVAASLQISRSFRRTLINAVLISEVSVLVGLVTSFYLNAASGSTIVLTAVILFALSFLAKQFVLDRAGRVKLSRPG
ncbi:metal ABC transporter permease [Acetonema longum]|uniref:ABC transporter n=1 Tax=Acetonema longum DSM 6540 TaxID=1009370 RepID=F7NDL2_9FIRM|nr:metal ABC transporter permease [Acetonema longum]EGO65874.1 ABC transporter [Acetonema longum DSM 6540]